MDTQQLRELANILDRFGDSDHNPLRVPLLHESADALRTAADQLEAVRALNQYADQWGDFVISADELNAIFATPRGHDASE